MTTQSNDIIIVGAGPTGLMLANQLMRFGVDYIILDQKSGPTDQSRALVVHSRSMEIYEQLGLSDKIIADGQENDGIEFYKNGKLSASVTLVNTDEKSSPFPFLMMYEQSKNENLLYDNLLANNKNVQWNTVINSIEKENDSYILKTTQGNNDVTYQCKYLLACDGSKSIVRDFSQVPFVGGTYLNVFYVADTHANAGISPKKLSLFLTKHSVTLLFPMKGEYHFRALGILPKEYYNRTEIPFQEILDKAKTEMKIPVEFYDTNWHSTYKLHHKKVVHFNKDNIFFVGDAAHVHSPAGGQGMNTGLQDAYNLAWKLALVQKGKAGSALLNTYHEERNPVANDLLKTTDRLFAGMVTDNIWYAILRLYLVPFFVPLITQFRSVRKQLFLLVSQIKINYYFSSLAKGKAGKIKAGLRLPYFFVTQNSRAISIYTLVNKSATPFTILLYNIPDADFTKFDKVHFTVVSIEKNNTNDNTFKEIGLSRSFVIVVRPDNHIGYISATADVVEIINFMRTSYFIV